MRSAVFLVSLCTLGAMAFAACGAGAPSPPPFRTVADVKQLMNSVVDPSADVVWKSAGSVITATGEERLHPRDEAEWAAIRDSAVMVTEAGNLLMMSPRAKDGDRWMKLAQELTAKGEAAWRAADAKDAERLFTAGADLYDTCADCHYQYMPVKVDARKAAGK